jgi:hypothetical protein
MDKADKTKKENQANMTKVFQANLEGDMGSLGSASYKLLRQHNFPHEYDREKDELIGWDHDRIMDHIGYGRFQNIVKRYDPAKQYCVNSAASRMHYDDVMKMLAELLEVPTHKGWTGFRIMGTVNRSNGYPVYTIELFKNNTGVKTYTGSNAPNVKGFSAKGSRRMGILGETWIDHFPDRDYGSHEVFYSDSDSGIETGSE